MTANQSANDDDILKFLLRKGYEALQGYAIRAAYHAIKDFLFGNPGEVFSALCGCFCTCCCCALCCV